MNLKPVIGDIDVNKRSESFYSDNIVIKEEEVIRRKVETIDLDLVVGSFKESFSHDTLYQIASKDLHKDRNISIYQGKTLFEQFLQMESDDLPSLLCIGQKYYIWNGGNHRLVLAKLLSIGEAKAVVNYVSQQKESELINMISHLG